MKLPKKVQKTSRELIWRLRILSVGTTTYYKIEGTFHFASTCDAASTYSLARTYHVEGTNELLATTSQIGEGCEREKLRKSLVYNKKPLGTPLIFFFCTKNLYPHFFVKQIHYWTEIILHLVSAHFFCPLSPLLGIWHFQNVPLNKFRKTYSRWAVGLV